MKRLLFPLLLVMASLVIAAIFTTVTAVTLESYSSKSNNNASIVVDHSINSQTAATVQR